MVVKIDWSAWNVIFVPVFFVLPEDFSLVVGTPFSYDCSHTSPSRQISSSSLSASAFTTETPTPCSPPETLYVSLSNFPPACNTVITTSAAGFFSVACMSTGMPRPLSITVTLLSSCTITLISSQKPAMASSTELSQTSQTMWSKPIPPVEPMYIAGRLRTASMPPRTLMEVASYLCPAILGAGASLSPMSGASPQCRQCSSDCSLGVLANARLRFRFREGGSRGRCSTFALPIGPSNFALGLEGFFFAPSRPLLADAAESSSPPEGIFRRLAGFARPGAGKHYVKLVRSPEAAHFWRNPSTNFTGIATISQGVSAARRAHYTLCYH